MSTQDKSQFRAMCLLDELLHQYDPDIPDAIIDKEHYGRQVRAHARLVDFIVWLKGVNERKETINARELISRIGHSITSLMHRHQLVVLITDKENVPMAKGVTQSSRVDSSVALSKGARAAMVERELPQSVLDEGRWQQLPLGVRQSIPQGMSFDEAVEMGFISEEQRLACMRHEWKRQQSLELHEERKREFVERRAETRARLSLLHSDLPHEALNLQPVEIENLTLVQLALVAVGETPLPGPWHEVLSKQRAVCLRYIMRALMYDPVVHVCPPLGKQLIIDGHYLSHDHHPRAGDDRNRQPHHDYEQRHQPLVLRHPHDAPSSHAEDVALGLPDHMLVRDSDLMEVDESETPPNGENIADADEAQYSVFESSYMSGSSPYAHVSAAPRLHNEMGEADFAIFHYVLQLLEKNEEAPPSIEIASVDTDIFLLSLWFLYKWQHNMFVPQVETRQRPLPTLFWTSGKQWSRAGYEGGSINMTAMYQRLIKYRLHGHVERLPQLLCAVTCAAGDLTMGYPFVTMKTFVETFYAQQDMLLPQPEPTVPPKEIPLVAGMLRLEPPCATTGAQASWRMRFNYPCYRRLVHCAYFKAYEKKMLSYDLDSPTQVRTDQLRTLINTTVVPREFHEFLCDPHRNPVDRTRFESMMRAFKKRMPPEEQIKARAQLVQHWWYLLMHLGAPVLPQYNLAKMGFRRVRAREPMTRNNITYVAQMDWEGREHQWEQQFGTRAFPTAPARTQSAPQVRF